MTASFHFMHSSYLAPALAKARRSGVNIDRLIRRSGLDIVNFEGSAVAIPQIAANRLIAEIRKQGDGMVPHEIARSYSLSAIPRFGDAIASMPDVHSALLLAGTPEGRLVSNNPVILRTSGDTAIVIDRYVPGLAADAQWIAMFSLFLIIDGFRAACGRNWLPKVLEVPFEDFSALEESYDLSDVTVRTGQPETRIFFDLSTLARRMPGGAWPDDGCPHVASSLQRNVFSILDSLKPGKFPSHDRIANFLGASTRTLQRRLAAEGSTYTDVLTRWRTTRALDLLNDPQLRVKDISSCLHYRHPSHFIRAFKKVVGVTPIEYRETVDRRGL